MKDMDRILRSKLYDHPSPLSEDLWGKIEIGLKEKEKKRGFGWIWFGSLALVALLGFASAQFMFSGDRTVSDPAIIISISDNALDAIPLNSRMETSDPKSLNIDNQEVSIAKPLVAAKSEQVKMDTEEVLHSQIALFSNSNARSNESKAPNQFSDSNYPPASSENTVEFSEGNEELSASASIGNIDQSAIIATSPTDSKIDIKTYQQLSASPKLSFIPALLETEQRKFKDPIGCPTFSNRYKANLFVEAYYQPLYAYSMLSSNSAEIGDSYLNLRRDSESRLYSWSAGVNVGWISDYKVGVKAGAEYEVINERFTYEDPAAIRNQTIIVIDTVFNSDGSFNVSMDTSIVQVSGSETQRIANYHRTLSIPVHALYHYNVKNFAFEISGGPIFNINYRNRGKIVDPSNEDQWFTNGESGSYRVYRNRLSVSFSLSVSAMYAINENIQVFARPQVKYHPTSISREGSPFNQRYLNSGIALGARYYFSGNPNY